jgi:NADH-quinone oxidoreductase subunit N
MIIESVKLYEMSVFAEFFLGISIMYLIVHGLFISLSSDKFPLIQSSIINLAALILFMACCILWSDSLYSIKKITFCYTIITDYLSLCSKLMVGISSLICLILIKQYLVAQKINSFEYVIILLFAVLGLFLLCSSNDFITAYLALELQSLSFYVLSAFKKKSYHSVESGLKYFILGSFSSGLFLFGASFIYGGVGTLNFTQIQKFFIFAELEDFYETVIMKVHGPARTDGLLTGFELIKYIAVSKKPILLSITDPESIDNQILPAFQNFLFIGLSFIFVSLFFKLALAPFHLWSPDVYENSPSSSAFFFAVVPKISIFVLLLRITYFSISHNSYMLNDTMIWYQEIIGFLSVSSAAIGAFGGLRQKKFKSLLAYSSISHMGYLMIAYISGTCLGFQMLLSYLIIYTVSGVCLWSVFMFMRTKKGSAKKQNKDLTDFTLLRKSNLILSIILMTALFSMAGLPPMIGFLVKLNILTIAIENSLYFVALFSILFSVISTFYYLRIIKIVNFEPGIAGPLFYPINSINVIIVVILFYLFIFLFINPSMLYLVTYKITLLYF